MSSTGSEFRGFWGRFAIEKKRPNLSIYLLLPFYGSTPEIPETGGSSIPRGAIPLNGQQIYASGSGLKKTVYFPTRLGYSMQLSYAILSAAGSDFQTGSQRSAALGKGLLLVVLHSPTVSSPFYFRASHGGAVLSDSSSPRTLTSQLESEQGCGDVDSGGDGVGGGCATSPAQTLSSRSGHPPYSRPPMTQCRKPRPSELHQSVLLPLWSSHLRGRAGCRNEARS